MHSVTAAGVALLACAGKATAARYTLNETYDATNFFDKFDFFSVSDAIDTKSTSSVKNQANLLFVSRAKILRAATSRTRPATTL